MAGQGDLLVIFGDNSARCWKQIIYFNAPQADEATPTPGAPPKPAAFEEVFDSDQSIVSDARGVLLAKTSVEDAD